MRIMKEMYYRILKNLVLKNSLRGSNHPLSRTLYNILEENNIITLDHF